MDYIVTDGLNNDFAMLCTLLDESIDKLAGHIVDRSKYIQYNTLEKIHDVVIVYDGVLPVACGGFRHYGDGVAEVKRVFVREGYRGRGISKTLMALLEKGPLRRDIRHLSWRRARRSKRPSAFTKVLATMLLTITPSIKI